MATNTIKAIAVCGLALACVNTAFASVIPEHVMKAYQLGMQGDQAQNQRAFNALTEINQNSANPVVLALLGSAETTQARYTNNPWQKIQFTEQGIAKLSSAVDQAASLPYPLQARVKVTAGCTFAQVPAMMNRAEQGRYLLNQVIEQTHAFASLEPALQASAYHCAAIAARSLSENEEAHRFTLLAEEISDQTK
ncbi:hypothetical protein CWE09_09350 [Aliidiomarina minuta]|uniref:Uncharacterized protein n=1 Tax=Aliidiomarina minuta TaxID=880057 RepID=A0A432WA18_9GAMM|nr:hypothetical protein [Aliidiomarina minuta]RUO26875.1 hypothetical protein CWE09_09350 [Aliidiomarina minuta]